jgi:hypothetical protein
VQQIAPRDGSLKKVDAAGVHEYRFSPVCVPPFKGPTRGRSGTRAKTIYPRPPRRTVQQSLSEPRNIRDEGPGRSLKKRSVGGLDDKNTPLYFLVKFANDATPGRILPLTFFVNV